MAQKRKQLIFLTGISVVFGWIMSFPYEGPIFQAMMQERGLTISFLPILSVFCHAIGLFTGGFLVRFIKKPAKFLMLILMFSFSFSLLFPYIPARFFTVLIAAVSFLLGLTVSGYAPVIQTVVPLKSRASAVALIICSGTCLMVLFDILSDLIPLSCVYSAMEAVLALGILLISLSTLNIEMPSAKNTAKEMYSLKIFTLFFLFIAILSINAGIMFQVILPAYSGFTFLVDIFTNLPYIIAVLIVSRTSFQNRYRLFPIGLLLYAASFVLFSLLQTTPSAFIMICALMLSACGIFDFLWWRIMFESFELVRNPSMLLGVGLSLNVFGVFLGKLIGQFLITSSTRHLASVFSLMIIVICSLIIIPLRTQLSGLFSVNGQSDLIKPKLPAESMSELEKVKQLLTKREYEVYTALLQGKSDKEICDILFVAKSTLKTHNRSIYKKLEVSDRRELIEKFDTLRELPDIKGQKEIQ